MLFPLFFLFFPLSTNDTIHWYFFDCLFGWIYFMLFAHSCRAMRVRYMHTRSTSSPGRKKDFPVQHFFNTHPRRDVFLPSHYCTTNHPFNTFMLLILVERQWKFITFKDACVNSCVFLTSLKCQACAGDDFLCLWFR